MGLSTDHLDSFFTIMVWTAALCALTIKPKYSPVIIVAAPVVDTQPVVAHIGSMERTLIVRHCSLLYSLPVGSPAHNGDLSLQAIAEMVGSMA